MGMTIEAYKYVGDYTGYETPEITDYRNIRGV